MSDMAAIKESINQIEAQVQDHGESKEEEIEEEEDEGPSLVFLLTEDLNRKDQLFGFRKETTPPPAPTKYRPSEKQLLQEGKLGSSEFSARLHKVIFGTYEGSSACLILVRVNFAPKNRGWFRFRNATIEAEFEEVEDPNAVDDDVDDDDDDEYHEFDEDEIYKGPLVLKFYPSLIRGHIQSAAETFGISLDVPVAPPPVGANLSTGWSITAPRESLHLIQGTVMGSPERRVKWTMNENEVSKSGIYEQPTFAVIVRYQEDRGFIMTLGMKAITYGGLAVTGKGGSRIKFMKRSMKAKSGEGVMVGLEGGAVQIGNQIWAAKPSSSDMGQNAKAAVLEKIKAALEDVDLESMTQMKADLLGEQGPGGGKGITQT